MKITEENKKVAQKIFQVNPNCNKVWVNPKVEYFTKWDLAASSVKNPKEELVCIIREEMQSLKADTAEALIALSVSKITEAIKSINNKEMLIEAVQLEVQNDNRKGAKEVIGNRIEELKQA